MSKVRIGLQIESTSPLVRQLIGSGKGLYEWDGIDPDEIVKVTHTVESSDIQEINPGIYYNIPSITTAKQGDTLFSDDGRLFVYDEAGSRWFLWYTFDNDTAKIHTNNTLKGEGTLDDPLSVNATVVALKGDLNPLLKGVDNGDGTYTFNSVDGNTIFTIDPAAITPVQSVNGQTGTVVLDPDDLDDTSTTNKFVTQALINTLNSAVQPGDLATVATTGSYSDLTGAPAIPNSLDDLSGNSDDVPEGATNKYASATNVDAAGATMNTDTDISSNGWVVDEDNMGSNDDTKVPTQQSVKAYVDTSKQTINNPEYGSQTLTDAASISWDMNNGEVATVTLGGNRALSNPTNLKVGTYVLIVKQDGTGSRTLTYGSAFKWQGGTAPTLSTAANAVDVLTFVSDGTDLYGVETKEFS